MIETLQAIFEGRLRPPTHRAMITSAEEWPHGPVHLTWIPHPAPYPEPVTSVHCFCFHGDDLILVDVADRGLGIPGGHLELGESPIACLERELLEEAWVTVHAPALLGAIQVDHRANPSFDQKSKYPEIGSLLIYGCRTKEVRSIEPRFETSTREMLPPSEVSRRHKGWNDVLQAALESAMMWHAKSS